MRIISGEDKATLEDYEYAVHEVNGRRCSSRKYYIDSNCERIKQCSILENSDFRWKIKNSSKKMFRSAKISAKISSHTLALILHLNY